MDKKAIAEIRRLMTLKNCRIDKISCYVNENREIVTELRETFLALEEETVENTVRSSGRHWAGNREGTCSI